MGVTWILAAFAYLLGPVLQRWRRSATSCRRRVLATPATSTSLRRSGRALVVTERRAAGERLVLAQRPGSCDGALRLSRIASGCGRSRSRWPLVAVEAGSARGRRRMHRRRGTGPRPGRRARRDPRGRGSSSSVRPRSAVRLSRHAVPTQSVGAAQADTSACLRPGARRRRRRTRPPVRRVAERLVRRVAAAAQDDRAALGKLELAALGVEDRDRPVDLQGPVRRTVIVTSAHRPDSTGRLRLHSTPCRCDLPRHTPSRGRAARRQRARRRRRRGAARGGGTTSSCSRRPRAPPISWPVAARCRAARSTASSPSRGGSRLAALAVGIPVGVRASVATALARGRLRRRARVRPGRYRALVRRAARGGDHDGRDFVDPERLAIPPRTNQRDRLLARIDRCSRRATRSPSAAAARFPGAYTVVPVGVDRALRARPEARRRSSWSRRRPAASRRRAPLLRALRELRRTGRRSCCAPRGSPRGRRSRAALRERVHVRTARTRRRAGRAPARRGDRRPVAGRLGGSALEAAAAGCAVVEPPGRRRRSRSSRPPRCCASPRTTRRRERDGRRRARRGRGASFDEVGERARARLRRGARTPARAAPRTRRSRSPTATGSSPTCTCTRTGRTTARSSRRRSSTTPRRRGSARSRSPTTTSSAARSRPSSWPAAAS